LSSLKKREVDVSAYIGMGNERGNELIDEAIDILFTVRLVFIWHELMSVPNEIDVKRRHKERDWGRSHEIEKAIYNRRLLSTLEAKQRKVAYAWYLAKAC